MYARLCARCFSLYNHMHALGLYLCSKHSRKSLRSATVPRACLQPAAVPSPLCIMQVRTTIIHAFMQGNSCLVIGLAKSAAISMPLMEGGGMVTAHRCSLSLTKRVAIEKTSAVPPPCPAIMTPTFVRPTRRCMTYSSAGSSSRPTQCMQSTGQLSMASCSSRMHSGSHASALLQCGRKT